MGKKHGQLQRAASDALQEIPHRGSNGSLTPSSASLPPLSTGSRRKKKHQQEQQQQRPSPAMRSSSAVAEWPSAAVVGHAAFPIFLQSSIVFFAHIGLWAGGLSPSVRFWEVLPYILLVYLSVQATRLVLAKNPSSSVPTFLNLIPFTYICFFSKESHIYIAMVWYFTFSLVRRREAFNDARGALLRMLFGFSIAYMVAISLLGFYCTEDNPIAMLRNENPILLREETVAFALIFVIHFGTFLMEYNRHLSLEVDAATLETSTGSNRGSDTPPITVISALPTTPSSPATLAIPPPSRSSKKSSSRISSSVSTPLLVSGGHWEIDPLDLEFGDLIGKGASGSVLQGKLRGERVAIKRLVTQSPTSEAQLLSSLRHRNIILFRGVVNSTTNPCIVIEYADGGSVYDFLYRGHKPMDGRRLVDWARQIAIGMEYLHTGAPSQVIHRDLKSSNILVKGNTLKISDFGLSKEFDKTAQMSTVGTYAWMAPEIIKHEIPYQGIEPVAIAFNIGQGTLSLPVDLEGLHSQMRQLLIDIFNRTPRQRPSFSEIVRRLQDLAPFFAALDDAQITSLQKTWRRTIDAYMSLRPSFASFAAPQPAVHRPAPRPVTIIRPVEPYSPMTSSSTSSSLGSSSSSQVSLPSPVIGAMPTTPMKGKSPRPVGPRSPDVRPSGPRPVQRTTSSGTNAWTRPLQMG